MKCVDLPRGSVYIPEQYSVHGNSEAGVLDDPNQLSQLSGIAIPARQATEDGHGYSLCRLAGLVRQLC